MMNTHSRRSIVCKIWFEEADFLRHTQLLAFLPIYLEAASLLTTPHLGQD